MKSVLRIGILLGVLILVTSGLVQAQAPAQTFCGDLKAADCTLLTDSEAAMQALESHSFKLDMNLGLSGLPSKPSEMSFKLSGSGAFATDKAALPDMTKFDPATFAKDPKALFDMLVKALPAVSGDVQLKLDLPADLGKQMGDSSIPQTIKLSLKLVDGTIYVNVGELSNVAPQLKGAKGWMGMNIPDLLNALMKQPDFGQGMDQMSGTMAESMAAGAKFGESFADPKNLAKFVKIERLSDGTVGSSKVAVFKTTLDYAAMFAMPEMQDFMKQQMKANGSKMSEKDTEAAMLMLQGLARGMEFTVTENIDLETKYALQTNMNMKFDFSSMKAQMGGAFVMTMSATVTQGDFNSVEKITAPEGALVIPAETIFPAKKSA